MIQEFEAALAELIETFINAVMGAWVALLTALGIDADWEPLDL